MAEKMTELSPEFIAELTTKLSAKLTMEEEEKTAEEEEPKTDQPAPKIALSPAIIQCAFGCRVRTKSGEPCTCKICELYNARLDRFYDLTIPSILMHSPKVFGRYFSVNGPYLFVTVYAGYIYLVEMFDDLFNPDYDGVSVDPTWSERARPMRVAARELWKRFAANTPIHSDSALTLLQSFERRILVGETICFILNSKKWEKDTRSEIEMDTLYVEVQKLLQDEMEGCILCNIHEWDRPMYPDDGFAELSAVNQSFNEKQRTAHIV
jgi:hypothetical protein